MRVRRPARHRDGRCAVQPGRRSGRAGTLRFLDVTGGVKPYLLDTVDNHLGAGHPGAATGRPQWTTSGDEVDPATRWRTTLPFPVQVVARVEVLDAISGGRADHRVPLPPRLLGRRRAGVPRLRDGRARSTPRPFGTGHAAEGVHYSPPTLTRTWFHPGPVAAAEAGDWAELDLRQEYWPGDPPMLSRPPELTAFLAGLAATPGATRCGRCAARRCAPSCTRWTAPTGRTGPYTVTEALLGVREESPPGSGRARPATRSSSRSCSASAPPSGNAATTR